MDEIELVVKIDEEIVQELKDGCFGVKHTLYDLAGVICNGIVLPKGHGRLIDEIIQELESTKGYPANDPASDEALDGAIEIIHKYQKIQKILNSASYTENGTVYSYTYDENTRIKHIREVLEDGNDDWGIL